MKKAYVLSLLALAVSLSALCLCCCRCEPIMADWMAILVGILALLVTFLVGWQITRTLDIERRMRRFDNIVDRRVGAISRDLVQLTLANERRTDIYTFTVDRKSTKECVSILMNSLEIALTTTTPGANDAVIDLIIDNFSDIMNDTESKTKLALSKDEKKQYIAIAKKVRHKKIDDVILFISEAETPIEETSSSQGKTL